MAPLPTTTHISPRSVSTASILHTGILSWVGVGALLAFVFISLAFGALEHVRKNSPQTAKENRKTIRDQKKALAAQRIQLDDLRRSEQVKDAEITERRNQVRALDRAERELKRRVEELEGRSKDTEDEMKARDIRHAELEAAIANLMVRNAESRRRENELDRNLGMQRGRVRELEESEAELVRRGDLLQEEMREEEGRREELERANGEVRLERNRLARDLDIAARRIVDLEREEAVLIRRVNFLMEQTAQG